MTNFPSRETDHPRGGGLQIVFGLALVVIVLVVWFARDRGKTSDLPRASTPAPVAQEPLPTPVESIPQDVASRTDQADFIGRVAFTSGNREQTEPIAPAILALEVPQETVRDTTADTETLTGDAAEERLIATGQYSSLMRAFSAARHQVHPLTEHESGLERNEGVRYYGSNPGQQITARFLDEGVRFESGRPDREWQAVFGADPAESTASVMEVSDARVEYQRGDVTEWFVNRPEGVEHGFTLHRRPSDTPAGASVEVSVPISGVRAVVDPESPEDLLLVTSEGDSVLAYSDLKVWDAAGTLLAASMYPTPGGLAISVDDSRALYPIEIDPLIISTEAKLMPEGGAANDRFADSVALSGDTALIGVYQQNTLTGSAYVFVRNGTTWIQQQKLTASDGVAHDRFGNSVALSGDTALIGADGVDTQVGNAGGAYVFVRSGTTWSEQQKLTASDGANADQFGGSVALDGNTALIGANFHDTARGESAGGAYVFVRSGTTWSQQQKLTASDGAAADYFGISVALSGDTALVGASYDDTVNGVNTGSAYVYVRSGSTWSEQQKLTASDGEAGDSFGFSVALSGDTALVGAYAANADAGSAYVFVRSGTTWNEQQILAASDGEAGDSFGISVALNGDTALVGAYVDDSATGSAYVYTRVGTIWTEEVKLTASDGAASDIFGYSVALGGDTVLIAANGDDTVNGSDAGSAYVFVRDGTTWSAQVRLTPEGGAFNDLFGRAVALSGDTALIGAEGDDTASGENGGSAFVFVRSGTTWSGQHKLIASDGAASDLFGNAVALSGDTALIGARGDESYRGGAYVFVRSGTTWSQLQKLTANDGAQADQFGRSVALSSDTALIGAYSDDGGRGSAYVFERSGSVWNLKKKLTASDGSSGDLFGNVVALSGDTALIGTEAKGAAYVFVGSDTSWIEQQKLTPSDPGFGDIFGISVALSGDTALIGAYRDDSDNGADSGSAYVFVRSGTTWSEQQKLTASDGSASDFFGVSVALSEDTALVGAFFDDTADGVNAGSAYVFLRSGNLWSEQKHLTAADGVATGLFGYSIALSGDTVLIGAYGDDTANGENTGSAYVFTINDGPYQLFHTHFPGASLDQPARPGIPRLKLPTGIGIDIQGSLTNFLKLASDSGVRYLAAKEQTINVFLPIFSDSDNDGSRGAGEAILDYQSVSVLPFDSADQTATVPISLAITPPPVPANHSSPFAREVLKLNATTVQFESLVGTADSPLNVSTDGAGRITNIIPDLPAAGIRVAWRVEGPFGIEWPYDNHEYQVEFDAGPNPIQFAASSGSNNPGAILPPNTTVVFAAELNSDTPLDLNVDYFINSGQLTPVVPGRFVVKYDPTPGNPRSGDETYVPLIALDHEDSQLFDSVASNRAIGSVLSPPPGATYGEVYSGTRFAHALPGGGNVFAETGKIIPVNTESNVEVWWHEEFVVPDSGGAIIEFPGIVRRYNFVWPDIPASGAFTDTTALGKIVIASQAGSGVVDTNVYKAWGIYFQNDSGAVGFNPNDEHALVKPAFGAEGDAIFALRDDLGRSTTSDPYVLMHYRDPADTDPAKQYRFKVFRVVVEDAALGQTFNYDGGSEPFEAGKPLDPPYPLSALIPAAPDNRGDGVSGPFFEDANGQLWAKAAGDDGGAATIVVDWYYRNQPEFFYPPDAVSYTGVEPVPFLDADTQNPRDVSYVVNWPTIVPALRMGETLVRSKNELPTIEGNNRVEAIYEQGVALGSGDNVTVIDFRKERAVTLSDFGGLAFIPGDVVTAQVGANRVFGNLPPALAQRLYYDSGANALRFGGKLVEPEIGQPWVLLNVITMEERAVLLDPSFHGNNNDFRSVLDALAFEAGSAIEVLPGDSDFDSLAVTAGSAQAEGFVTLAFNNNTNDVVSLEILRVIAELYRGAVQVINPQSLFDEKLTLIFDGDLGGRSSDYEFEWRSASASQITDPQSDSSLPGPIGGNNTDWSLYALGTGKTSITIDGSGAQVLSDNYYTCRYRPLDPAHPLFAGGEGWSDWTPAQLAEGWIKRVLTRLNLYEQRFDELSDPQKAIDTRVSMVSLAGPRWEGSIPFTQEGAENSGLIEAYETILRRGIDFSIESIPPVDDEDANKALRLAATRLADLYLLLGHEAYSDATDPTIAISAEYNASVTSIHSFQNGPGGGTLLEEELSLLRGRDDGAAPGVTFPPVYNRLLWNFTGSDGEVAYVNNYGIRDNDTSGGINESDAKVDYPQGHGDAWGHYLTAIKSYYRLLHHPEFSWPGDLETILLGGVPVEVDYRYGARFAKAAASRAQAGSEIVSLTYREQYSEDPAEQWRGYPDQKPDYADGSNRAWGMADWGARAGQGAYLDWVVGNAILPATDADREGSQKIDRTTISELRDLSASLTKIQSEVDKSDRGLSPLGLIKNTLPLSELSAAEVDTGITLFEKTYEKTVTVLNNALAVFIRAQGASQQLREQADNLTAFQQNVDQREMDFRNRMIEIYGRPYSDDIGGSGQYRAGYDGPDIYHYMYTEPSELTGMDAANQDTVTISMPLADLGIHDDPEFDSIDSDGVVERTDRVVTFHLSTQGFGYIKPASFTGARAAEGQLQIAHSEILQARARMDRSINDYDNLLGEIEDRIELLQAQYDLNASEIAIERQGLGIQERLNDAIAGNRAREVSFRHIGRFAATLANAAAEGLPNNAIVIAGLAAGGGGDFTAPGRAAIRTAGALVDQAMAGAADAESLAELGHQQAKERVQAQTSIRLTTLRNEFGIVQEVKQIEGMIRHEAGLRLEIYTAKEGLLQAAERYKSLLAQGFRLQEERLVFRQQTAANVQQQRFKDMAFRIFRNDALEKYRAQFDLAATWVYLAVRAYDYDTNYDGDGQPPLGAISGRSLLESIVKARAVGEISGGQPIPSQSSGDGGLADPMARMKQNWDVLKGPLGYNQVQNFTTRFSLRKELFRIPRGTHPVDHDKNWRETLQRHVVENIRLIPEIARHCKLPNNNLVEPAIVIPFATTIEDGLNFFGWPLEGGENNYPSTLGANRIQKAGVWYSNYDNSDAGLPNTPQAFLVPVGADIMRTPTGGAIREWRIQEQVIPIPFPIANPNGLNADWIPGFDSQVGSEAQIRRYAEFRAYHDSGSFSEAELIDSSRLIGRSVWNTRWLLIIRGRTLNNDPDEGIRRFIEGQRNGQGVKDILINFKSYAIDGI